MINNVTLVGRLTKDPELRKTNSGKSVGSFDLAVDDSYKDAEGNKITYFFHCVVWGNTAEASAKYGRKGDVIGVVGRLTTRKYTNRQGIEVTVTEIACNNFELISSKKDREEAQKPHEAVQKSTGSIDGVNDDDLPF